MGILPLNMFWQVLSLRSTLMYRSIKSAVTLDALGVLSKAAVVAIQIAEKQARHEPLVAGA
jgi:hypothetical protein